MQSIKRILSTILISLLCFMFPQTVEAEDQPLPVVVIHQIRGKEMCCQPGTSNMIKTIMSELALQNLPLAWSLRYDALLDEDIMTEIKNLPETRELGILLEVTPMLASDSGVIYKGDSQGKDWYNGRNAFLIGYDQSDRKKIIDTVFNTFYKHFSYYPVFTVAWMVDSWSLQYLRDTYGVRIHELTKEQYETDSYTLYGGIFNLPYFPEKNHPLIPALDLGSALDLLLMRQTVSDLDKNYGSNKSYYTSQPNDYLKNPVPHDLNYFITLIDVMRGQSADNQFALLGLENSSEWTEFQDEYMRQLGFIEKEQQKGTLTVMSPFTYYTRYRDKLFMGPSRVLKSPEFPQSGVLWYFGKKYRARLEVRDGKIILTDLRVFTQVLSDPYINQAAATNRVYWIVPYVLDSSQEFQIIDNKLSEFSGDAVRVDQGVERFGLILSKELATAFSIEENTVILNTPTGKISLYPDTIVIEGDTPKFSKPLDLAFSQILERNSQEFISFPRHPRFVIASDKKEGAIFLGWENDQQKPVTMVKVIHTQNAWQLIPRQNLTQTEVESLAMILQPDKTPFGFDLTNSTFFWHNKEAIAGKTAVRLYIDPRNVLSRPVAIDDFYIQINEGDGIDFLLPKDIQTKIEPFLVDFTASQSARGKVSLKINDSVLPEQKAIRFYIDCSMHLLECLKNQDELKGFVRVSLRDRYQAYTQKISQQIEKLKFLRFSRVEF